DGQKYVVHIDAEAFEAGTSGGGAANDSSVGTGNSHSDDSESRNGRGTSLDEEEGMVEFNYKTDGLEKFQEAVEKYDVTNLFKQVLPPGKHVINVSIDPSLGSDVGMHNPDASAILVNPDYLAGRSLAVIGSSVGHELIHVNDRLRGRINSYESESMRASERGAYSWQVSTANHFGLSRPYRTWLRNKISGYR
ncbi:hypothetical protein, partial [Marinimicrobium sp. ARAG 43.8]|uniref:hypothetical protein n=1 Tax=Marinimicrobium sp. ARAG 43.8 TaxID=3418719 RepID=UPI003CF0720C